MSVQSCDICDNCEILYFGKEENKCRYYCSECDAIFVFNFTNPDSDGEPFHCFSYLKMDKVDKIIWKNCEVI